MKRLLPLAFLLLGAAVLQAKPKQVKVFIALCDNKTQGIVPVGAKIGNGDDPDANLYWGCSDGFGSLFSRGTRWKVVKKEKDVSPQILRRLSLVDADGEMEIVAEAYRGSEMKRCLTDFEAAAAGGTFELVAFIGHNGLMDFQLEPPKAAPGNRTDVMVLCCISDRYFSQRLKAPGCRPRLMTRQLMYPGAFLLDAALPRWNSGGTDAQIREAAAAAYAKNQKISVKAARGVFWEVE